MYAHSFMASQEVASEGTSGSQPVITQQDQIATVTYRPGDVAKPNETAGEVSVALPFMSPEGTLGFQDWAVNSWDAEGRTKTNPSQEDYKHEPSVPNPYLFGALPTVDSQKINRQKGK